MKSFVPLIAVMVMCVSIAQGMSVGEPEPIEERVERGGCEPDCAPGWQRPPNDCTGNCTDTNECTSADCNNCSADATCTNKEGGYKCDCNKCFTGNGFTCSQNNACDECEMCTGPGNQCLPTARPCGYRCKCGPGFQPNGQWNCKDKNECKQHPCHPNAQCYNCYGSYDCVCNPGYCGNGFDCHDIDECDFGRDNCDTNAHCDNYDGGFACRCYYNYVGTGIVGDCYENSGSSSSSSSGGHSGHRGHGGHGGHGGHRFGRDADDVEV